MASLHGATPALLGSTLLANEEKHESLRPTAASCGNEAIDREALDGGFRYGEITCIAGVPKTGKTLVSRFLDAIADRMLDELRVQYSFK